jgi:hypothetical protein
MTVLYQNTRSKAKGDVSCANCADCVAIENKKLAPCPPCWERSTP